MEHHVEIGVWALVWCLWVFCYTIVSLQLYFMEIWVNENVIHDDNNDDDIYLIQFWLSENFDDNDNNE